MSQLSLVMRYIKYWRKGKSKYFIHSPFVYEFVTEVLDNPYHYYAYDKVEALRKKMKASNDIIEVTDFGAGSKHTNSNKRKIGDIANNAAKPKKFGQLLHRIVAYYQPNIMFELGTSLGISSCYQTLGNTKGQLYTMEGCPKIAAQAKQNFKDLGIDNITQVIGDFNKTLPATLDSIEKVDYAFFDGNHRKEPTLSYFHQFLSKKTDSSIFIFDDIHWSDEMEEAWEEIKRHPEVTVTLDLFFIGLVFFKKDQAKEHFTIRFPKPKEQNTGGINSPVDFINWFFEK